MVTTAGMNGLFTGMFDSYEVRQAKKEAALRRHEQQVWSRRVSQGKDAYVNPGYGILSDADSYVAFAQPQPQPSAAAAGSGPLLLIGGAVLLGAVIMIARR
jgi:hypothetical protein